MQIRSVRNCTYWLVSELQYVHITSLMQCATYAQAGTCLGTHAAMPLALISPVIVGRLWSGACGWRLTYQPPRLRACRLSANARGASARACRAGPQRGVRVRARASALARVHYGACARVNHVSVHSLCAHVSAPSARCIRASV